MQGGEEGGEVEGIERQGREGERWEVLEGTSSWAGICVCLIYELEKNGYLPSPSSEIEGGKEGRVRLKEELEESKRD